jgi:hypothetical protein
LTVGPVAQYLTILLIATQVNYGRYAAPAPSSG